MVLSEEKRAKLAGTLTRLRGMSRGVGNFSPYALASITTAPSPTPSTPVVAVSLAAQSSPTPFPHESKVVEIESDENFAEGPLPKRLKPMPARASYSSSTGRSVSPGDRTTSVPLFSDFGGTSAYATRPALELPLVL